MSKKANQTGRRKGSDKKKDTIKRNGKFSQRGIRIKLQQLENEEKNKKEKQTDSWYKNKPNNKRKGSLYHGKKESKTTCKKKKSPKSIKKN